MCYLLLCIHSGVKLHTASFTPALLQIITNKMLINRIFCSNPFKNNAISRATIRLFSESTNENRSKRRQFLRQSQGQHAFRPLECPENPTIILFPGQGSQFVGMAKSLVDIPDAKDLFDIASDILRFFPLL